MKGTKRRMTNTTCQLSSDFKHITVLDPRKNISFFFDKQKNKIKNNNPGIIFL
jgi:hypothetical protein